ncbi:hypothetical protein [Rhodanobacter sp. L36]|uniref:hypothetical protein n=1 Tax=Rhodanobacter sp. L36 TaxID=1747221 RepID=UPI00131AF512|nr:hypothetical protein [Rhodanobacter sp. L36]
MRERLDALDLLELGIFDDIAQRKVNILRTKFEAFNEAIYRELRQAIRQGAGAVALSAWSDGGGGDGIGFDEGYDYLDEIISGVLQLELPDDAAIEPPPDMVFYQPTPARHVFDLIRRLGLTEHDVLMDLGSGLGHVPLIASICSDATCVGIERERSYVDCFRRSAASLGLSRAACFQQDARDADFSTGTVFYLYTPFTGGVMRAVLDGLKREAGRRSIRVASYGPCTAVIADEPWLHSIDNVGHRAVALFGVRG